MSERIRILETYKKQFYEYFDKTITTSCMVWGLEVPEEWLPAIEKVCDTCEKEGIPVIWEQVKEKFNTLRMYYRIGEPEDNYDDHPFWKRVDELIMAAEVEIAELEKARKLR